MVYSDTTNKDGILQLFEDYTGLGDGVVTGNTTLKKKATSHVNETVLELTTDIMLLQDDFDWDDVTKEDYGIATTPLVADQRDYQFDSLSFLKLKRVDITYDGTNYYKATPFDSASYELGLGNDTVVDADFDKTAPQYDPKGFGFWLYPRASASDVTAGALARIEYSRAHTMYVYTDTTKEAPIDRNFQNLIPMGASIKWLSIKNPKKAEVLMGQYMIGRERMKQHYARRNEDAVLTLQGASISKYS